VAKVKIVRMVKTWRRQKTEVLFTFIFSVVSLRPGGEPGFNVTTPNPRPRSFLQLPDVGKVCVNVFVLDHI